MATSIEDELARLPRDRLTAEEMKRRELRPARMAPSRARRRRA